MLLHMLHSKARLSDCLAALSANDTLLLLDDAATLDGSALIDAPCTVILLVRDAASHGANASRPFPSIDVDEWVALVFRSQHSLTWN